MKKKSSAGGSIKIVSISVILFLSLFSVTSVATSEQVADSITMTYSFPTPVISKVTLGR